MKKTLLLTLALGLAGATSLTAGTVEVFLTGSTAFRASVYTACTKLFTSPTIYYGNAAHGGADSGFSSSTAAWVMTGTPVSTLTNIQGNTLIVHGLFTGSIQGIQTVEQQVPLIFPQPVGAANGLCTAYTTNTPTIGFSDASGVSSPYPATGNYFEESVCVQPFVVCKSAATSGGVTSIGNVSWEQLEYGIPAGRIPLSAWTYKAADTNTFIYLYQRTKDSGTRRCETAQQYFDFNATVGVYIYDFTNNFWYPGTNTTISATPFGAYPNCVVGAPGLNNVNLTWGAGYVGGGDIKNSLNNGNVANQALGYLSIADAKGVNNGGGNWSTVISYNGVWPTATGAGIHGNSSTNDFSPITQGYYPCWGTEVLVHPVDPGLIADSKISQFQLGDQFTPGSFLGVFNAQTLITGASTPVVGSIENEIELSKPGGATAIRLSDMRSNRSSDGGTIYPF